MTTGAGQITTDLTPIQLQERREEEAFDYTKMNFFYPRASMFDRAPSNFYDVDDYDGFNPFYNSQARTPRYTRQPRVHDLLGNGYLFPSFTRNKSRTTQQEQSNDASTCNCPSCYNRRCRTRRDEETSKMEGKIEPMRNNIVENPREFLLNDQEFFDAENLKAQRKRRSKTNTGMNNMKENKNEEGVNEAEDKEEQLESDVNESEKVGSQSPNSFSEAEENVESKINTMAAPESETKECKTEGNEEAVDDDEKLEDENESKEEIFEKIDLIESIRRKVNTLVEKVDLLENNGATEKDLLYFEEMLTKCLLELDNILANGNDEIRNARRTVIEIVNENISKLYNTKRI